MDVTAQWVVNSYTEEVSWEFVDSKRSTVRIGTAEQKVLGTKGDKTNINWGYMYLQAVGGQDASIWAGSANASRSAFAASGKVQLHDDMRKPRKCSDELPTLALSASLLVVGQDSV